MKSFSIENIRSFKNSTEIEIKPITILVGKNSCGKSSLIRFPVVLAQTTSETNTMPLHFYGKMIDYGTFDDVIYNHNGNDISYSLKYDYAISFSKLAFYKRSHENKPVLKTLEIKTHLGVIKNQLAITCQKIIYDNKCIYEYIANDREETFRVLGAYDYEKQVFDDVNFEVSQEKKEDIAYGIFELLPAGRTLKKLINESYFSNTNIDFDNKQKQNLIEELLYSKSDDDDVCEVRNRIKTSGKSLAFEGKIDPVVLLSASFGTSAEHFKDLKLIQNELWNKFYKDTQLTYKEARFWYIYNSFGFILDLIQDVSSLIRRENSRFSYLGPFRQEPERIYRYSGNYMYEVGVKGENVKDILFYDYQNKEKSLIDNISAWLNKSLGYTLLAKKVANGYYQLLLEDKNGIKANITDVGYGISQVLPIVTQIMMSKPIKRRDEIDDIRTDIIVVEQPELHLHPAAQAELADLFVACVNENKNQRMLIETHSEHFIRKLQVLVADKNNKITSDDVAVYYVDKNDNGEAFIDKINILPNGQFEKEWPTGFFDKAFELAMELVKSNSEA